MKIKGSRNSRGSQGIDYKNKWVMGNVLYDPVSNKLHEVLAVNKNMNVAIVLGPEIDLLGLSAVALYPENTPGVNVWTCLGPL